MRISSALVALVGATAGVATGVTTYQSSAEVPPPPYDDGPVLSVGQPLPGPPAQVRHQLADCVAPAVLQGGACVTTVVRNVPAPAPEAEPEPAAAAPAPAAPAPAAPAAPAPAPAAAAPAQWSGAAGSVVVRCDGEAIALQAATPADGYEVEVDEGGPEEVKVEFESDEADAEVEAACAGGTAQFHAEEDD
jgi:hypothetical protein